VPHSGDRAVETTSISSSLADFKASTAREGEKRTGYVRPGRGNKRKGGTRAFPFLRLNGRGKGVKMARGPCDTVRYSRGKDGRAGGGIIFRDPAGKGRGKTASMEWEESYHYTPGRGMLSGRDGGWPTVKVKNVNAVLHEENWIKPLRRKKKL